MFHPIGNQWHRWRRLPAARIFLGDHVMSINPASSRSHRSAWDVLWTVGLLVLITAGLCSRSFAQTDTGRIVGTVTDPTGQRFLVPLSLSQIRQTASNSQRLPMRPVNSTSLPFPAAPISRKSMLRDLRRRLRPSILRLPRYRLCSSNCNQGLST